MIDLENQNYQNLMNKNDINIEILLATYNGETYISQQIDSIINQTYPYWRILVSDDGSTDGTLNIVRSYAERYPDKIKFLKHPHSFGNARDNFFYLMSNCEAGYIMFCDQDDVWNSDKIEMTIDRMKQLEKENRSDFPFLVFTDLEVVDADLNLCAPSFLKYSKLSGRRTDLNYLLIQNVVTGCTVMINRELKTRALQYQNANNILMHDWWLALIAQVFGKCAFIDVPTVKYRQHGNNSVGAKNIHDINYLYRKIFANNDMKQALIKTTIQAKEFLESYQKELSDSQKNILKGYSELYMKNKLNRLNFIINNKIYKYGFSRKFAQFIWG